MTIQEHSAQLPDPGLFYDWQREVKQMLAKVYKIVPDEHGLIKASIELAYIRLDNPPVGAAAVIVPLRVEYTDGASVIFLVLKPVEIKQYGDRLPRMFIPIFKDYNQALLVAGGNVNLVEERKIEDAKQN